MRGHRGVPALATGSANDQVWRKRLLGRLNDIDTQDFATQVGLRTEFAEQGHPARAGLSQLTGAPQPLLAQAAAQPMAMSSGTQHSDNRALARPLDQVSGDVVAAWSELDARREKLVLAQQSALHLAQRSRRTLMTAGLAGFVGVSAAFGFGVLQMVWSGEGGGARVEAAAQTSSLGVNRWEGFARAARPIAEASLAMRNGGSGPAQIKVATIANPRIINAAAQASGHTVQAKGELALPEPQMLKFSVALDGAGERTALLPLRLNDATAADQQNTIIVRNVPHKASLSAGVRLKTGEWALHLDELEELQIFLPAGTPPTVELDFRVMRPRGEVIARTQVVLTTETQKRDMVADAASAPVREAVAVAVAPAASAEKPQRTQARKAQPVVPASQTVAASAPAGHRAVPRQELHHPLGPAAKTLAAAAEVTAHKAKAAAAKKATEYSALGADFAQEARARAELGETKPSSAKSWLESASKPMPAWMPAATGQ